MSDDHTARAASLDARLSSVQMEIDDDDEDVILVSVDMTNEAVIPLGGLEVHVLTSDGRKVESDSGISSLGPGLTRNFSFEFPLEKGTWTFSVSGAGQSLSMGPYEADFTFEAEQGRAFGNAIGSTLFSGAFDANLDSFGKTAEREIIDPSSVVLTSYSGENASGGSTKISLGEEQPEIKKESKNGPRTPPWEQKSEMEPSPVEQSSPAGDLLLQAAQVNAVPEPVVETPVVVEPASKEEPVTASTPPPLPTQSAPPSSGPPTGPPSTAPPAGPPSGPPSTAPPAGPPSGPPAAGPPSGPPTGPPTGPPSGPPTDSRPARPNDL